MGTPAFAVPSLVALCERPDLCEVVGAFTQPDRPVGRGRKVAAAPVKIAAEARRVPCFAPTKMKSSETLELLRGLTPDLVVVAAYGRILPPALLAVPPLGCLNVHASLLPRYRGASPIVHAILAGDPEAGVSIMRMEAGLDTGPVFCTRACPIDHDDTGGSLTVKLAELGAALLVDSLAHIVSGRLSAVAQDDNLATYAPLLRKEEGELSFDAAAATLARRVRAFDPWPGTCIWHADNRIAVLRAHAEGTEAPGSPPGTVLRADGEGVQVACAEGTLWIDAVKPAGRQAMTAGAWVAGRGIVVGTMLKSQHPKNP